MLLLYKIVSCLFIFVIISNCNNKKQIILKEFYNKTDIAADVIIKNFIVESYKNNKVSWSLKSKEAYIQNETDKTYLFIVDMLSYGNEAGKKTTTHLISDKGLLDKKADTFYAEGNVVVTSSNGRKLYTDNLLWFRKNSSFETNAPVKIISPNGTVIYGIGMTADMNISKINLKHSTGIYNK